MWQNNAAFLRQSFNSRPLKKDLLNRLSLQRAEIKNLDLHRLEALDTYQLYIEDHTESLLKLLHESLNDRDFNDPSYLENYQNQITLAACKVENMSEIAYLTGLSILQQLNVKPADLELTLENIKYLEPRVIPSQTEIDSLLNEKVKIEAELLLARGYLTMQAQTLLNGKFQEYANIDRMLEIHPTDSQHDVVGKAIALRQLGRIEEAIDAYNIYGQMFPDAEPPTHQYVTTAIAFTRQIVELDAIGGVYIYQVVAGEFADRSGIMVGDIVTHCDRKLITTPKEMAAALTAADDTIKIVYIRLDRKGLFTRTSISIEGNALGIEYVGI
jgi:tetratricopeptide (TPR) repeat protein